MARVWRSNAGKYWLHLRMKKQRLSVAGLVILALGIVVWTTLPKRSDSSGSAASIPVTTIPERETPVQPSSTLAKSVAVSDLWMRPSADVASRNRRKSGFAWVLRALGATEQQLDRLAGGDLNGVMAELKQKAKAGDLASIRVLGQLAVINCRPSRGHLTAFKSRQITEAQALSAADRDWFTTTVNDDIAFDRQMDSACDQIDSKEALSSVTALGIQGDGGSLWVLSQSGLPVKDMQQRLREASDAGFALAQYTLALWIDAGREGAAGSDVNKLDSVELLNQSASAVPASKAELADCEYFGECEGIPVDIDAAIAHAREAAQDGAFSAILKIGPHLPPGQMYPNEVTAWRLVDASVQQQGCGGGIFTVRAMQNIMSTLSAPSITAAAREQAEQFWSAYGAQIKATLGCGP
ncbi:MAG TPA: hypothetical protein VK794_11860 [Steroidobacteraceae bacterium]|nr:hypothetical protein [Steroidobacteraceae bacterium]